MNKRYNLSKYYNKILPPNQISERLPAGRGRTGLAESIAAVWFHPQYRHSLHKRHAFEARNSATTIRSGLSGPR